MAAQILANLWVCLSPGDTTAALTALGITHPVRLKAAQTNNLLSAVESSELASIETGIANPHHRCMVFGVTDEAGLAAVTAFLVWYLGWGSAEAVEYVSGKLHGRDWPLPARFAEELTRWLLLEAPGCAERARTLDGTGASKVHTEPETTLQQHVSDWLPACWTSSAARRVAAITLATQASVGVAGVVWEAAKVLSRVILSHPAEVGLARTKASATPARLRVLELGSGTGICGLVVAAAASSSVLEAESDGYTRSTVERVLCTDCEAALPLLRSNVIRNTSGSGPSAPIAASVAVESAELDWVTFALKMGAEGDDSGGDDKSPSIARDSWDLILGADCTYDTTLRPYLAHLLGKLLSRATTRPEDQTSSNPRGLLLPKIVLAHCCRGVRVRFHIIRNARI